MSDELREMTVAEVVPSITGERGELWIFQSICLDRTDDIDSLNVKALQLNAAAREFFGAGDGVDD